MATVLTEPELFDWLKEFYYPDLVKSVSQYSKFDCYSTEWNEYIELKSRHTHYDDLLIEKIKYVFLMDYAQTFGFKPVYINCTEQGIWKFMLDRIPQPAWEKRQMPTTTEFENNEKIDKVVGYLHIKDGVKL